MAKVLNGSFNTSAYNGRYLVFSWSATQSTATNQSTIKWTLKGAGGSGYYKSGNFKVVIAGETVYSSTARIDLTNGYEVASGTKVITHGANGSKSFSASAEAGIYTYAVNCSGSGSWDLKDIPRAATITSAPNFNDEESPKVEFTNHAGSAVDSLAIGIGTSATSANLISYIALNKTDTSYTFKFTTAQQETLWGAVTAGTTATVYFILKTVINGVTYTNSKAKTLTLKDALPTVNPSVVDIGSTSIQITKNTDLLVKGFNVAHCSINAAARKGATIKTVWIRNGETVKSGKVGNFTADFAYTIDGKFYFNAEDSRGNRISNPPFEIAKDLIPWFKPTITFNRQNMSAAGVYEISVNGAFYNGAFGTNPNTLNVEYKWRVAGGSWSDWVAMNISKSGNEYTATASKSGLNYQTNYDFQVRVYDAIGAKSEDYKSFTNEETISSIPVFDWGKEDFNFNVPISIQGNPLADYVVEEGKSGIWNYRLWNSGKAECWGYASVTTAISTAWGSMYVGNTKMSRQSYPFTFTSKPVEIAGINTATNAVWVFAESGSNGTNNTTQSAVYNICRPSAISASSNYHIELYVCGSWK